MLPTWAAPSGTTGRGTAATGGRPSTEDGHIIAFGGTEESLRHKNLGLKQRGDPSDRPFKRDTGRGYVAPSDGDYTDALSKQHPVTLAITETSGAITDSLASFLHILARTARAKGATDNTRYGLSRASTTSFYVHHLSEISTAVQVADANTIINAATHESFMRSLRPPPYLSPAQVDAEGNDRPPC